MKLLIINPNISESVTSLIEKEARLAAAPGTEITMLTAPMGVAYIETRFEAMIAAYAVAELAANHAAQHDAVILAAFGDPGLEGLREALDIPVLGMTESALMSACMLGKRFSIIAISRRITAWYRDMVERNGLIDRLASIRCLDEPLRDIASVQDDHAARLQALCEAAVSEDGADVLIIAGAPLAGLARSIKHSLPVPAVDGVSSAVNHAQSLVSLAPPAARAGSFAKPPRKEFKNLPPGLTQLLNQLP